MQYPLLLTGFIALGILVKQDFASRQYHVVLIPIILVCLLGYLGISKYLEIEDIAFNTVFVLVNLIGLQVYYHFRIKRNEWFFDRGMGWGDVLLFLPAILLFEPFYFVVFTILSAVTGILFAFIKKQDTAGRGIPLAGIMGIYMNLWLIYLVWN